MERKFLLACYFVAVLIILIILLAGTILSLVKFEGAKVRVSAELYKFWFSVRGDQSELMIKNSRNKKCY